MNQRTEVNGCVNSPIKSNARFHSVFPIFVLWFVSHFGGLGDHAKLDPYEDWGPNPNLTKTDWTGFPTINYAKPVPWPEGATPNAAAGLQVKLFAKDLKHPRWLYVLPNGDVLVAETAAPPRPGEYDGLTGWIQGLVENASGDTPESANRITLLHDDGDGVAKSYPFLEGLNSPFGMALVGNDLYVANTDAIVRYPYQIDRTEKITAPPTPLILSGDCENFSGNSRNHHWTKNIIPSADGSHLYITIGSNSNIAEHSLNVEKGRARILEVEIATGKCRVFASGLRNPNGLAWEPVSGALWTAVNERDQEGSDVVPDYITSVKDGGFYGWPYIYYGHHIDPAVKPPSTNPAMTAIMPDYAVGAHTASLGLAFSGPGALPADFSSGAFVGQHGSWNRRPKSGYQVVFVPFEGGVPKNCKPKDCVKVVLDGFLDEKEEHMRGRPVGVALDKKGALLVADDVGNAIWRVTAASSP